jgi:hypothetical protein
MSQPFGASLAVAVGVGLIISGVVTAAKGITKKFERYLRLSDSSGLVSLVCVYGLVARGLVFAITGIFFAYAGLRVDPKQAGSMADAMEWVRQLPFGAILYIAVAIGLAAFGIYNLVEARYRVVRGPSLDHINSSIVTPGR